MDFLGLRNLTTLEAAVKRINERHPDSPIDIDNFPWTTPRRSSSSSAVSPRAFSSSSRPASATS